MNQDNETKYPDQDHKTGLEEMFVLKNHKKLRLGYTTGSCAAAASKAAAAMLLTGETIEEIALMTPKGILLHLLIEEIRMKREEEGTITEVSCAVRKDGGDDPDATNGILVYSRVKKIPGKRNADEADPVPENQKTAGDEQSQENRSADGEETVPENRKTTDDVQSHNNGEPWVQIDGGIGVGRVTKPGLNQPVGNAAINSTPRQMITEGVLEVCRHAGYNGGIDVEISIPEGVEIAKKTFNPRLGIEGGISVLGTSGIVMPMSEEALVRSIGVEMRSLFSNGGEYLVITPGNYGETFSHNMSGLDLTYEMKCSNFVGETIDLAEELGVKGILFIAHIGKFIKVSGGIMNTHSREADCRAELMAAAAVRAGADAALAGRILATGTTEEALDVLAEGGEELYRNTLDEVCRRVHFYLNNRCKGAVNIGAILFSSVRGKLGETENAQELIRLVNHNVNQ
ncbi:MAG: cobalt-precorrin-5B (C(1))-methyltransferase CbiD [Lachnospiraceae bacterium]|nr:cobalt-precorrin-5B (C(1))-methyltransferase CbiD [Lachnospiraceae bacterium]